MPIAMAMGNNSGFRVKSDNLHISLLFFFQISKELDTKCLQYNQAKCKCKIKIKILLPGLQSKSGLCIGENRLSDRPSVCLSGVNDLRLVITFSVVPHKP